MLTIKTGAQEPYWLDASSALGDGVRFLVKPVTVAIALAARDTVMVRSRRLAAAVAVNPGTDVSAAPGENHSEFTRIICRAGIVDWEGIGDASGNPVKPTPALIDKLLDGNLAVFDFLDREYVDRGVRDLSEKNGLSPSQAGTSGAKIPANPTAAAAKPAATAAPTSRTRRKPPTG